MNIINTLKNYFNNNSIKVNFPKTSKDNIFDKLTLKPLDQELSENENYINALVNYCTPRYYTIQNYQSLNCDSLNLSKVGNLCLLTGGFYTNSIVNAGGYNIPLPTNCRPTTPQVFNYSPFVDSGTTYRTRETITRNNPSTLEFYTYDRIPSGTFIPVNLVFMLDNNSRT